MVPLPQDDKVNIELCYRVGFAISLFCLQLEFRGHRIGEVLCLTLSWWSQFSWVTLLVGCLTSQQHASVSQGRICTDNFTCCYTEIEAADQTCYLTQSQYTDTGPTSPSADPIMPGVWQGIATGVPMFKSPVWLDSEKSRRKRDSNPGSSAFEADALTTRPTRPFHGANTLVCQFLLVAQLIEASSTCKECLHLVSVSKGCTSFL